MISAASRHFNIFYMGLMSDTAEWCKLLKARLQIPVFVPVCQTAESEPDGSVSRNFGEIPVVGSFFFILKLA
jgi:hypothetical protein